MAGNDLEDSVPEGTVRRRHSAHYNDDASMERREEAQLRDWESLGGTKRSASDPPQVLDPTFANSHKAVHPARSSTNGQTPRVRFSTDIEKATPSTAAGSDNTDGSVSITSTPFVGGSARPSRLSPPNLSNETGSGTSEGSVLGQGILSYPAGTSSSDQPERHFPSLSSRISAISPTSRNRGYSLRRSLFTRSVDDQVVRGGSTIELEPAEPSWHTPSRLTGTSDTGNEKKLGGSVITIEPAIEPERLVLPPRPVKKSHGISALPHYEDWAKRRAARPGLGGRLNVLYERARKTILRIQDIPPSKDGRHINLNAMRKKALLDERTNRPYINNTIRSSRFTVWNFLPRQLFAQFSKLANFYFLCVSILQMIPTLSTTGTYTTIVPLLFFVSISMAKEGYDDLRRYKLDKAENNEDANVLHAYAPTPALLTDEAQSPSLSTGPKHWAKTKWKDIHVGDIVKLERNKAAPADLVLLHSSGINGVAYIETMALDGETNLKNRQASLPLARSCSTVDDIARCDAHLVVEDPNLDLYKFEGKVTVAGETQPLSNNEIIYRGSILRNTPDIVGVAIFTGEECKIRMNATKNPRIKAPALQDVVNKIVVIIVIFVVALAIFNTVAYEIWSESTEDKSWYLTNAGVSFFPIFASFIIMFNTMIPLSLYVSLEIVKLAQMALMNDIDMYDEMSDTPMEARTSTINEELGQISYIFSDKTGTLTDNSMRFRKMSIAGTTWIHDHDLQIDAAANGNRQRVLHKKRSKGKKPARRKSLVLEANSTARTSNGSHSKRHSWVEHSESVNDSPTMAQWHSTARPSKAQPELRTQELLNYMQRRPHTAFARKARLFLLSIALCHTCLPEIKTEGGIEYQAASPDELALVKAAQELGYMIVDRQPGTITVKLYTEQEGAEPRYEVYEILDVIEFSSKRKRMSIIVRFPDHRICIICKGADSTIMQLLKLSGLAVEKAIDVERRASEKKSVEAQEVIRRNSEQSSRKNSMNRPSLSLGRSSIGGTGRASMNAKKLQPIRDELDEWLKDQKHDVGNSTTDDDRIYRSPRASEQMSVRHSFAVSEARSSLQRERVDDLIDDVFVVDDASVFERCFQHINDFATEGLRTLLYGYRFIGEEEYTAWKKIYLDATTSLINRQAMIENAGDMVEKGLELAGATAIEDRLQNGVPETIEKLRRAKIKLWMLTGDKRETAINIGHSCRLIKDYSSVTVLDHENGCIERYIAAAIVDINSGNVAHSVVVVDGQTLALIEDEGTLRSLFFDLAILVDSVICCRASPSQKASLVHAIRTKVQHSITLAIGDGANDIAMIQEAHVGIGITGKEGLQAARTSDYSIAQFRFLLKLLLVHGRWNYIRTCKYTIGTFWKEMLFYLTQALYQRWAGYTGTSLYESWSLSMFNTLFTSLPVIFIGIFEKDLAASTLLAVPELYTKGQGNGGFNIKVYLGWMFMAASEAMVVFFIMLGLYGQALFTSDNGLFAMGALTFTSCVVLISVKLQLLEMHNKSIAVVISMVLCVGGWFMWNILLSVLYKTNTVYDVKEGFLSRFGQNALWWLVLILILISCVMFEVAVGSLRLAYWPTDVDLFREYEQDLLIRKRFEEAASVELQQGWDRGDKKSTTELERAAQREGSIQDLLNRPRVMEEGRSSHQVLRRRRSYETDLPDSMVAPRSTDGSDEMASSRRSADIREMLSRGFGAIRPE
ncbi:MAG: hypothetical protein M1827_001465 [Pycnora praestabilis]|nr:MAG: hypothetical protein M1827_001465 [Pycnora praestabilis]